MRFKALVEYEYPIEHKPPVKAEIVLHGDRVITNNIKWIEQEPKTGHWIEKLNIYGVAYCSECGYELKIDNTNYCPNCGCRMSEVDNGNDD